MITNQLTPWLRRALEKWERIQFSPTSLETITVNGRTVIVPSGTTVAVALLATGHSLFRHSTTGQPRGPLCGMGVCFECRVTINGRSHQKSCQIPCESGLEVWTDA